jgi:hypothetical protein
MPAQTDFDRMDFVIRPFYIFGVSTFVEVILLAAGLAMIGGGRGRVLVLCGCQQADHRV